jgi:hypothetical protein
MFFLISNVVLGLSGSFFEKWGMAFSTSGKSVCFSDHEVILAVRGIEDFDKWKSFSFMRGISCEDRCSAASFAAAK